MLQIILSPVYAFSYLVLLILYITEGSEAAEDEALTKVTQPVM